MPPPISVNLVAYDTNWPHLAEMEAVRLQVLGSCLVGIHHIGSTSVPGLAAKPIIDLMPLVTDLRELDAQRPRLEALGYVWHGELGIAGRRYCTISDEFGIRRIQAHFFEAGSPQVERHIAFRDYLRAHPEAAAAYENEKRRAQKLYPNDSHAYTDEKNPWIRDTEARALLWFSKQQITRDHHSMPD